MRKLVNVILGILLLSGASYWAYHMINNQKKRRFKTEKATPTVFVQEVKNSSIPISIEESGRLIAKNRMEVYSEVQGVMEKTTKEFKPGKSYFKGEVLVKIRANDYYANLQAQKSVLQNLITSILPDLRLDFPEAYPKWDQYLKNFDMDRSIGELPEPDSEKEKFFITGKNIYTTYYNTKNLEIVLQKYTIRAPFSGVLIDAMVTPGTVVRPGQKIGEFIDPSVFEMEISISKQFLESVSIGQKVEAFDPVAPEVKYTGKISRINGRINTSTQTVQVFVELNSRKLKEGMYLNAVIDGNAKTEAFEIDRSLLVEEKAIYAVNDSLLVLKPVTIVHKKQNAVIVVGLQNGEAILGKMLPGAYEGMTVKTIKQD